MYVYDVDPIDLNWEMLISPSEYMSRILEHDGLECNQFDIKSFIKSLDFARKVAKACTCWEGDIINNNNKILPMPDPDMNEFLYGFVWKQKNNGSTFIVSPLPLFNIESSFSLSHKPENKVLNSASKSLGSEYLVIYRSDLKCIEVRNNN